MPLMGLVIGHCEERIPELKDISTDTSKPENQKEQRL